MARIDEEKFDMTEGDDRKREGDIWLNRLSNARSYESQYRRQAYSAYKLYNKNYEDVYIYSDPNPTFSSVDKKIEHFSARNNRSNLFYANIETLVSLVIPELPAAKIYMSSMYSYSPESKGIQSQFYDLAIHILEEVSNYFIKQSFDKDAFRKFKLDHFITGRGVLWVDNYAKIDTSIMQPEPVEKSITTVDYVHWLDFACDPKLNWKDVRWVARRLYLNKIKLKQLYPDVSFENFSFTTNPYMTLQGDDSYPEIDTTYLASGGKYAEVWEIWDKYTQKRLVVSQQSQKRLVSVKDVKNVPEEYFFPCAQPPQTVKNGLDNRPTSEVWSYLHELRQLSYISQRKEQLLRSLILRGFCSATNTDMLQRMQNSKDGDIIAVNQYDPENPNVITYIDNKPKVELLNLLSQEHEQLKNNIYEITGISDQMRNVAAQEDSSRDDQTATEVKTKTLFGSRRLREKQDLMAQYLREIFKLVIFRTCYSVNVDTLKEITNLVVPDSNGEQIQRLMEEDAQLRQELNAPPEDQEGMQGGGQPPMPQQSPQPQQPGQPPMQPQQPMPPAQPAMPTGAAPMGSPQQAQQLQGQTQPGHPPTSQQPGQPQGQPQQQPQQQPGGNPQQKLMLIQAELQQLRDTPTWESIMNFYMSNAMQQISVDIDLDDLSSLIGKAQLSQQNMVQAANLMQTMGNVVQMAQQMPEFVETFTSLLESSCDSSLYSISQKKQIRDFCSSLKNKIEEQMKQPPPPPPPNPQLIQAQAYAQTAQAKMMESQAKMPELQAEAQLKQAQAQAAMMEMQLKQQQAQQGQMPDQQNEMMKGQIRQQEASQRHQEELEKLQMQIQAQDARAKDKMMSDENLMKLKIEADNNRYREKLQADVAKERMKGSPVV